MMSSWKFCIKLFLFQCLWRLSVQSPPCSLTYFDGIVDIEKTLWNCSANIPNPRLINSFNSNSPGPVSVEVQIKLNNLIKTNEIDGTVDLDMTMRLYWIDTRWDIPGLFDDQKPDLSSQGIIMDDLLFQSPTLPMWIPRDVQIQEAIEEETQQSTVKFFPNGKLYWARHLTYSLSQPQFDYAKYPEDKHDIQFTIRSYAHNDSFLTVNYTEPAISYYTDVNKDAKFSMNQVWSHTKGDFYYFSKKMTSTFKATENSTDTDGNSTAVQQGEKSYDIFFVSLHIIRKSSGVIQRFVMPVLILMMLSGVVFWARREERASKTMSILLAVTTLYIVLFRSIPLVGYLTSLDSYIMAMFLLLTVALFVHQAIDTLSLKIESNPMRLLFIRVMEFFGRLLVFPLVIILFYHFFSAEDNTDMFTFLLTVVIAGMIIISIREIGGILKVIKVIAEAVARRVIANDSVESVPAMEAMCYALHYNVLVSCRGLCYSDTFEDESELKAADDTVDSGTGSGDIELSSFDARVSKTSKNKLIHHSQQQNHQRRSINFGLRRCARSMVSSVNRAGPERDIVLSRDRYAAEKRRRSLNYRYLNQSGHVDQSASENDLTAQQLASSGGL